MTARLIARRMRVGAALLLVAAVSCKGTKTNKVPVQTAPVTRRTIAVETQATGTVEPINLVEVKSKASGLVTKMPVDVGSNVKPGDLLVQIDTRDVNNQYNQSKAAERAAAAKLEVSTTQKKRADDLFGAKVITAPEHEAAVLDYANAQSQLVAARTNLDLAKQRLEDATVRASVTGTVLAKSVSQGTVVTSSTSAFGGGTTILTMANLAQVRMRVLVNETDIGSVKIGQDASVVMDAFPNRPFHGTVEKVEPQAVVQQNVTMFPVLVSLDNRERSLMPGMNGEVHLVSEQRDDVLAVPVDAVRSMREVATVAPLVGLDPDSARMQLQAQMASMRGGAGTPGGDTGVRTGVALDSTRAGRGGRMRGDSTGMRGDSTGRRRRGGDSTLAGRRRGTRGDSSARGAAGGAGGGAGAAQGGGQAAAGGGGGRSRSGGPSVVFVKKGEIFEPRIVRTGVNNFEYIEVRGGVQEGEQVALLAAAALQAKRDAMNDRFRGMAGGPLGPGSGAAKGGAAGGARSGGAPR